MPEYTPEQLWPLFEKLPVDLKEAVFSVETADNIYDVCTKNGLGEEKIPVIARYTGYVLLGVLSPNDFEKTLKGEGKLSDDLAKKIGWEISRLIFFPLRASLEVIYKIEMVPVAKLVEEVTKEKSKKDVYREPPE